MLNVNNLCKSFKSGFKLDNLSFSIDAGYITGFIGMNGAGKTTTIKCIMNMMHPDSGEVKIFGKDMYSHERELKQKIGFTVGAADFYNFSRINKLTAVYKRFYDNWDDNAYYAYLKKFGIDENKKVKDLSQGMRVKLGITYALSHGADLIILDEPTSGLDPVARDELLDLFREIVSEGDKSILFSTHITGDLDKCADYILFIAGGKKIAFDTKDDLIDRHALVQGDCGELENVRDRLIGYKQNAFGFTGLMKKEFLKTGDNLEVSIPDLQDLMVYYNK